MLAWLDEWADVPTIKEIVKHTVNVLVLMGAASLLGAEATLFFEKDFAKLFVQADHFWVGCLGVWFMRQTAVILWNRRVRIGGTNVFLLA